jgi:hypothetical protein
MTIDLAVGLIPAHHGVGPAKVSTWSPILFSLSVQVAIATDLRIGYV